ncbi:MAG: DegT/DnrJ/EryC1/StrS aminotransferase [Rickettsiales bacterium]|nr:DegT/DnrJ/EryC1/StrS aminotransferase [Rickettsiales bacterium]
MSVPASRIPLMRPKLPDATSIFPYLEEIDRNRRYSNFGPMERLFEARLAGHFDLAEHQAVCVSNCTLGLEVSLRMTARYPSGYCLMPSFTFVATAHAAVSAGFEPYFLDVDPNTWALDPEAICNRLSRIQGPIAAIMPVAPFGAPVEISRWTTFTRKTSIPVVLDAAASFDKAKGGRIPLVLSLHATKVLGIGEGGVVLCTNEELIKKIRAGRNFGFLEGRSANLPGTNAKLSEYNAAVGLAALDRWKVKRQANVMVAREYLDVFSGVSGLRFGPGFSKGAANSTCNVQFEAPIANRVIKRLDSMGIESRKWWNNGCHNEPNFLGCSGEELQVTQFLADRVVGLPFFEELNRPAIIRIRDAIESVMSR